MARNHTIVLICGLANLGAGCGLLFLSPQVAGLAWIATPIAILGLVLIAVWVRSRFRLAKAVEESESSPVFVPGAWYPFAILGIGAVLFVWILYLTKIR